MSDSFWNRRISASSVVLPALLTTLFLALLFVTSSCSRSANTQRTFATPEDAGAALLTAAGSGDRNSLIAIFGPNSKQILVTADPHADDARLQAFVTAYGQMHRWRPIKAGGQVLQVGANNYPFPIPLGRNSSGRWYFDTTAGKDELLARRIGRNELNAMDATKAIAGAEHEYCQEPHAAGNVKEYARKFVSDSGQHDGLYWPVADGQAPSPLGQMGNFTKLLSSGSNETNSPQFSGYRYRILTRGETPGGLKDYVVNGKMTGGFAILAYPSEYRDSGIMSFLIGDDGTLYQKDLGTKTAQVAATMAQANPKDGWTSIESSANTASRMKE